MTTALRSFATSTSFGQRTNWKSRWRPTQAFGGGGNGNHSNKRRRRLIKIISASTLATAALAGNMALKLETIKDERRPNDPIGPVYKFDEDQADVLPLTYDVNAIERYWRKRPLEVATRALEICSVIVPYFTKLIVWEYLIRRQIRDEPGLQKKYAVKLRLMLTELGPCFIKFGQAMSIRPDLLPSAFLFELQKLCDSVPSFPTRDALSVIESELG